MGALAARGLAAVIAVDGSDAGLGMRKAGEEGTSEETDKKQSGVHFIPVF